MKPTTMQRLSLILLTVIVFATSTAALLSAWWLWGPVSPDYAPTLIDQHRAEWREGDIVVTRAVRIARPMRLTVTHDLVKIDEPKSVRWAMPALELSAGPTKGDLVFERRIEVPYTLPPGRYELRSAVEWPANPLRSVVTQVPPLQFTVPAR